MITGFNPADMYAADHIRRVLQTFPGVFSGIGEFTIHKEFVSSKIAGDVASLTDPALDRILDFAGEVGLVVILHNDIDMPFPKPDQEPYDARQLARRCSGAIRTTTIIWAHCGVGRIVRPLADQVALLEKLLADPATGARLHRHLLGRDGEVHRRRRRSRSPAPRALINRYPDRFLFGTDEVAPTEQAKYLGSTTCTRRSSRRLTPEASEKLRLGQLRAAVRRGAA